MSKMTFVPFKSWQELLAFVETHRSPVFVYYRDPMNLLPRQVEVIKVFKNGKLRIDPILPGTDKFTADSKHLERFMRASGMSNAPKENRA